jgi:hypothetical protein
MPRIERRPRARGRSSQIRGDEARPKFAVDPPTTSCSWVTTIRTHTRPRNRKGTSEEQTAETAVSFCASRRRTRIWRRFGWISSRENQLDLQGERFAEQEQHGHAPASPRIDEHSAVFLGSKTGVDTHPVTGEESFFGAAKALRIRTIAPFRSIATHLESQTSLSRRMPVRRVPYQLGPILDTTAVRVSVGCSAEGSAQIAMRRHDQSARMWLPSVCPAEDRIVRGAAAWGISA